MIKEGFPPKKVRNVRDLILTKAKQSSNATNKARGTIVSQIESLIFSILIATNSAIKIETIKSIIPNCPISRFPIIRYNKTIKK